MTHEKTGLPFAEGLETCVDLPHTITAAIAHRAQMDSIFEIPKDKRPPRGIWEKSYRLEKWMDEVYGAGAHKRDNYTTIDLKDVE